LQKAQFTESVLHRNTGDGNLKDRNKKKKTKRFRTTNDKVNAQDVTKLLRGEPTNDFDPSFWHSEDVGEEFDLLSFDRSSTARRQMEAILYHIRVFVSKRNQG
ncbi:hypothetical protein K0M31_008794, partial [Melipona bicolor]